MNNKKIKFIFLNLLCGLILFSIISCENMFAKKVDERVTINYVSLEAKKMQAEREVAKDYILTFEELPQLNWEGYNFLGWEINGQLLTSNYQVSKDVVVIAKWEKIVDKEAPSPVTDFVAVGGDAKASLTWVNPTDVDLAGIKLSMNPGFGNLSEPIILSKNTSSFCVEGLVNNNTYYFDIRTFDFDYNYSRTERVVVTPKAPNIEEDNTAPQRVTALSGSAIDGKAIIKWENPTDSDFDGLKISMDPPEGILSYPIILNKEAKSFSIDGLTNGVQYKFSLFTFDKNLNMSSAKNVYITPKETPKEAEDKTPPSNPYSFNVISQQNGSIELRWYNPSDKDFSGLKLSMEPAQGSLAYPIILDKNVTSYKINDLSNGESYNFSLQAFDDKFNYSSTATVTGTPKDTTDRTNDISISSGRIVKAADGVIEIEWDNPFDFRHELNGIILSMEPAEGSLSKSIKLHNTINNFKILGVTNGTEHTITLKTVDNSGNLSKPYSLTATPIDTKDYTKPQKVSNFTVTGNKGKAIIKWDKVPDADLKGYKLSMNPPASTLNYSLVLNKYAVSYEIDGLDINETYTFKINSFDTSGNESDISETSIKLKDNMDLTPPSPISNVQCNEDFNKIILTWENPIGDKDFAGTKISIKKNQKPFRDSIYLDSKTTSFVLDNLEVAKDSFDVYDFRLYTYDNDLNFSEYVGATDIITSERTITPVSNVKLADKNENGIYRLTWKNPNYSYFSHVNLSITNISTTSVDLKNGEEAFELDSTKLKYPESSVELKLIAYDTLGNKSEEVMVNIPSAVSNLETVPGDGCVLLKWTNPEYINNLGGVQLIVQDPSGVASNPILLPKETNSYTVYGLTNDTKYTFILRAYTTENNFSMEEVITSAPKILGDITPPSSITDLKIDGSNNKVHLTWSNPTNYDSLDLKGLKINISSESDKDFKAYYVVLDKNQSEFTFDNLKNDIPYKFEILAFDENLNYSTPISQTFTTKDTISPIPVSNLKAVIQDGNNVLLTWKNEINSDLKSLNLTVTPSVTGIDNPISISKDIQSYIVKGIDISKDYAFTMTSNDTSDNVSSSITHIPAPVSNIELLQYDGKVKVSWVNPQSDIFSGIELQMTNGENSLSNSIKLGKTVTSYTTEILKPDQTYTFSIRSYSIENNFSTSVTNTITMNSEKDTTSPGPIKALRSNLNQDTIFISWANPQNESDFAGTKIRMDPPKGILKEPIILGPSVDFFKIDGLDTNVEYTFYISTFDTNNNYSTEESTKVYYKDRHVNQPKNLVAESGDGSITLKWDAYQETDILKAIIKMTPMEGSHKHYEEYVAYPNTSYTVNGLINGKDYTLTITIEDKNHNTSEPISISCTPISKPIDGFPANVTNLAGTGLDKQVILTWSDPNIENLYGIEISHKQSSAYRATLTPFEPSSIFITPKTQRAVIRDLVNNSEYEFTVRTINLEGKKSNPSVIKVTPKKGALQVGPKYLNPGTDGSVGKTGTYVEFGIWPQTHLENEKIIKNPNTTVQKYGWDCYEGTDGCYYVKKVAVHDNPYAKPCVFDNGKEIVGGTPYYFKLEPLKWRVASERYIDATNKNTGKLLICENILLPMKFDGTEEKFEIDYGKSEIRQFLNNEFFNKAFTAEEQQLISLNNIDNSAESMMYRSETKRPDYKYCFGFDNTQDRVFLLSAQELSNPVYGFNEKFSESSRAKGLKATDYAKSFWMSLNGNKYGCWWGRSVEPTSVSSYYSLIRGCSYYSEATTERCFTQSGVVPSITIDF